MYTLTLIAGVFACCVWGRAETLKDYWPLEIGNRWVYQHRWSQEAYLMPTGEVLYYSVKDGTMRSATTNEVVAGDVFSGVEGVENTYIELEEQVILEVVSGEEHGGQQYARLSNGQVLRKDDRGNIFEYNNRFGQINELEFLVFDFVSPPNIEDDYRYRIPYEMYPPTLGGQVLSQDGWRSWAYRRKARDPVVISGNTYPNVVSFYYGDPIGDCGRGLSFAAGIGLIYTGCGNDTGQSDRYELVEATISGVPLEVITSVSLTTWGVVKLGHTGK